MSAMLKDTPEVLGAYKQYKDFSANPVMRERVRVRQRFLDEQQIRLSDAREDGLAEGVAIGMTKGEAKKARESATIMIQDGFDAAVIARVTGLPLSEIERLS